MHIIVTKHRTKKNWPADGKVPTTGRDRRCVRFQKSAQPLQSITSFTFWCSLSPQFSTNYNASVWAATVFLGCLHVFYLCCSRFRLNYSLGVVIDLYSFHFSSGHTFVFFLSIFDDDLPPRWIEWGEVLHLAPTEEAWGMTRFFFHPCFQNKNCTFHRQLHHSFLSEPYNTWNNREACHVPRSFYCFAKTALLMLCLSVRPDI